MTVPDLTGAHGILGGTFDPVHVAHLAVAEAAADDLGLSTVMFVPAAQPPHKQGRPVTPVHDRLAMVEAAIADNPRFTSSRMEVDREGPSYTADTLAAFHAAGVGPLALILSAEAVVDLPSWHRPERILELATLVVTPRDGYGDIEADWLERTFPGAPGSMVRLAGPRVRLAASDIRRRAAAGRSLRYLVPDAVATYIGDHGLYRAGQEPGPGGPGTGRPTARRNDRS